MPRTVVGGLSTERFKELARAGAESTLQRLRAEIVAIERTFPELAIPARRRAVGRSARAAATTRTRQMSAAARKAVSARMKKYWAERRKAQGKTK